MIERQFILRNDSIRGNMISFLRKIDLSPILEVIVRPYIEKRTLEQNARLWKLHSLASEHTGHSAEEMHEFALMRYFGTREISVGKLTQQVPLKRSSQKNRKEFRDFMESTEAWYIQEFGVYLDQREAA
jgi:hypothetical protein